MPAITAAEARKHIYHLLYQVADSHIPVRIVGKRNTAVLVSAEDWRAIEETLHLASLPGMRESIKNGLKNAGRKKPEGPWLASWREVLPRIKENRFS